MRRGWALLVHASRQLRCRSLGGALFRLPSVMESKAFARYVQGQGEKLEGKLFQKALSEKAGLDSRAFRELERKRAKEMCLPLTTLTRDDVERVVTDKYKLTEPRIITCLVPYQVGANILLSRLPQEIRQEAVEELKGEEALRLQKLPVRPNKWIQWYDPDVYVSTGIKYLKRIHPTPQRRIPVFALMGHAGHGKTALLDALQDSSILTEEPHHVTQSIRAFTVPSPLNPRDLFTLIDAPGHRVFVETRFHLHLVADFILLVVSVVDGVQSQTHEAIKVALNVDKPIVVALTKVDALSDSYTAKVATERVLTELSAIGLDVHLIQKEQDIDRVDDAVRAADTSRHGGTALSLRHAHAPFFAPMKLIDPAYQGSKRHPRVDLRRKCYGVCVSAMHRVHIPLLWRLLRLCRDAAPPTCHSSSATHEESNAAVQAVVLESSKHLFDEEGFRLNRTRQQIQRTIDAKQQRRNAAFKTKSRNSQVNSISNSVRSQFTRQNRTSTTCLVITVIVREGVLSKGMHFVADQAEGQVHDLLDYWGNRVTKAYPGMAVTIVDRDSMSGCPGAGIHVLSVTDVATRVHTQAYRQVLQWYVECFTNKLHYLRPRGMDVSFAHLGDYGQIGATDSLEAQLLYGSPPKSVDSQQSAAALPHGAPAEEKTIGAYLAELNEAPEPSALQTSTVNASLAFPDGQTKRLSQGIMSPSAESIVSSTWDSAQRRVPLRTQEEYEQFVSQCVQVGVVLKVDSWHTSRMLQREIARLGTRKIFFQVVGSRFGPLRADDIFFFGHAAKIIVCFRTPVAASYELDGYIESTNLWVLQTDSLSDVVLFLKWCAVALHKDAVSKNPEDDEADTARPKLEVSATKPSTPKATSTAPSKNSRKLLIYRGSSEDSG